MDTHTTVTRRNLLGLAALPWGLMTGAAGQLPEASAPAALSADDGELFYMGRTRDPLRIKVTSADSTRLAMITQDMAPGSVIPIHLHEREDEIIFIQAGRGEATVDGRRIELAAGATLFVPQGTWHGGENTGNETLEWVAIYSPPGFEGYFREVGIRPGADGPPQLTRERFEALNLEYGIRYPA